MMLYLKQTRKVTTAAPRSLPSSLAKASMNTGAYEHIAIDVSVTIQGVSITGGTGTLVNDRREGGVVNVTPGIVSLAGDTTVSDNDPNNGVGTNACSA
jgi:hypothetical protein